MADFLYNGIVQTAGKPSDARKKPSGKALCLPLGF